MAKARAFYPLTFPISCGPARSPRPSRSALRDQNHALSLVRLAGSIPGIIVVSVTLYICLRFAAQMLHRLGDNGTAVFMRLSAFIMLCLGVQIFWEGARELMVGVLQQVMQPIPVPKVRSGHGPEGPRRPRPARAAPRLHQPVLQNSLKP